MLRGGNYGSYGRRRRKSIMPKLLMMLLVLAGAGYYVYTSDKFEREKPTIDMPKVVYAGSVKPLKIEISDNGELAGYSAYFTNGVKVVVASSGIFDMPMRSTEIIIPFPDAVKDAKEGEKWQLEVTVKDKSLWGYLQGNSTTSRVDIVTDTKPPKIEVISKSGSFSLYITRVRFSPKGKTILYAGTQDKDSGNLFLSSLSSISSSLIFNRCKNNIGFVLCFL